MDIKNESPVVIVLDIDGTIVGDVTPQIMLYELVTRIRDKDLKLDLKDFTYKLRTGIIRPHLGSFLKKMKETYQGNIEYFIYTAAEKKWTHFLIPQIEKVLDTRFNRPLFTRDNCKIRNGECKKSIDTIMPKILKTLSKKYGKLTKLSLKDKLYVIDNSRSVYDEIDQQHLIVCPTYDFKIPENVPSNVTYEAFNKHHMEVIQIVGRLFNTVTQTTSTDYVEFQKDFYKLFIPFLAISKKSNITEKQDRFFNYLCNLIIFKGITRFSPKTISYLQKKINNRLQKTIKN